MNEPIMEIEDQTLHSFVDGELTAAERRVVLARLAADPKAAERLCELRNLKDTVRLAYAEIDRPHSVAGRSRRARRTWPVAASILLLLCAGVLTGWFARPVLETNRFILVDNIGRGEQLAQSGSDETRIVVHVGSPDQFKAAEILDEVEQLLEQQAQNELPLRVEVVANGPGLDLLRKGLSVFPERIAVLARRYPTLTFVACQNTIDRLQVERGIEVVLLPGVEVTRSGVNHLARRQHQGWVYIDA